MVENIAIIYPLAAFTLLSVLAFAIWQRRLVSLAKQRNERSVWANRMKSRGVAR